MEKETKLNERRTLELAFDGSKDLNGENIIKTLLESMGYKLVDRTYRKKGPSDPPITYMRFRT